MRTADLIELLATVRFHRFIDFEEVDPNLASLFNGRVDALLPTRSTMPAALLLPDALVSVDGIAHCRTDVRP